MIGEWCPYKECLFCLEESGCPQCDPYYASMPVPYDGRTVEEIDQASSRLFGAESRIMLDNDKQRV